MKTIAILAMSLLSVTACQKAEQLEPAASTTSAAVASNTVAAPAAAPYDLQFLHPMSAHHASAPTLATMAHASNQQLMFDDQGASP